ncbi:MAG: hypothetical protein A2020_09700 [Lentisphaerae bacterium GWF2_45_14]|nr:MAG: hypothetical protein A2020_09700 [Lentisphaerae bacterium GWF2_45_14]
MSESSENISPSEKTVLITDGYISASDGHLTLEELDSVLKNIAAGSMEKFSKLKTIGSGGTATIISAYETALGREVAIKVLRTEYRKNSKYLERFIREARATAQIEHPNIVPIHEIGVLDSAGIFFTMKRVNGETLKDIIEKIYLGNQRYIGEYPQRRLLEIFSSACQGVAFAHSRGIIHRDLKPENIMVGDYGEVLVLDWGLVKHIKEIESESGTQNPENIQLDLKKDGTKTVDGAISGTPLFMSPEQAIGDTKSIDQKTDIYSLGTILYSILTLCGAPFDDTLDPAEILNRVEKGDFVRPKKRAPKVKISRELEAICLKAMSTSKHDRYPDVKSMIADIRNYQYGFTVSACATPQWAKFWKLMLRHPVISSVVAVAVILSLGYSGANLIFMHARFTTARDAAMKYIESGNSAYKKSLYMHKELDAMENERIVSTRTTQEKALEEKLHDQEAEMENNYSTALMLYFSVPPSYEKNESVENGFKCIMKNRIDYSLMTGNYLQARKWLNLLKIWFGKRYQDIKDQKLLNELSTVEKMIMGETTLVIKTIPYSAELGLYRLKEDPQSLLRPVFENKLGKSPLTGLRMIYGSYLIKVTCAGIPEFIYPVFIRRGIKSQVIEIEIPQKTPAGTVYVPAGDFLSGGVNSRGVRLRSIYLPGFFIKKNEVTFSEYLEFWKSIKSPADKLNFSGKIRLDENDRCFLDAWDNNGNLMYNLKLDRPVTGITLDAAKAYCRWLSAKTDLDIRLPSAEEWEKAARGVDGREYVWGNYYRDNLAYTIENEGARKKYGLWAPPGSFPEDVSIYGVNDMEGNVREFTTTRFLDSPYFFQIKGASSSTTKRFLFCAYSSDTAVVPTDIGFRYVIPYKK